MQIRLAAERHAAILERVREGDVVRVEALADELGVSVATVRRDLKQLETQGVVNRLFGGASAVAPELSFTPRSQSNVSEKARIARVAAALVHSGETVALDTGTTVVAVASALRTTPNVAVVTNSTDAMLAMQGVPDQRLVLTGGIFDPVTRSLHGPLVQSFYSDYQADKLFIGAGSVSVAGLRDSNLAAFPAKRAAIAAATQTIVVADSSKFRRSALALVIDWTRVGVLVTDDRAPSEPLEEIRAQGVEVILA
jgi:DeoR/GlpR family transcriptional regulator of sugar metabolism